MGILHGQGDSILNAIAGIEGPHKGTEHPWRSRATDLLKLTKENTPFMSLWATSWATDATTTARMGRPLRPRSDNVGGGRHLQHWRIYGEGRRPGLGARSGGSCGGDVALPGAPGGVTAADCEAGSAVAGSPGGGCSCDGTVTLPRSPSLRSYSSRICSRSRAIGAEAVG
jgi:hypothetical protein